MADKRMFSKRIVNSGSFLSMPPTARLLYYDLGMIADDDGYCEYFTVIRLTNANPDDLKILQAKRFVEIFDEYVLFINDWSVNNSIRKDTYIKSRYKDIYPIEPLQVMYEPVTQIRVIRKEKNREESEGKDELVPALAKADSLYSSRKSITAEILKELAIKYDVELDFVVDCWDSAVNWLDANGRVRKDYKAFLSNWIKRERAASLLQGRRKGGIHVIS